MKLTHCVIVITALFTTTTAIAENVQADGLLYWDDLTTDAFPEASGRIIQMMQPGTVHGNLGSVRRGRVERLLSDIQRRLDRPHRDPNRQELALRRDLKSINELLATSRTAQRSEMVCRRDRRLGSNISETACMNRKEVEERAQLDRDRMRSASGCMIDPTLRNACEQSM